MNGSSTPDAFIPQLPVGLRLRMKSQYGSRMNACTRVAKKYATTAHRRIAMVALSSRLRSSRMCSMRVIEPSAARWKPDALRRFTGLTIETGLLLLIADPMHGILDRRRPRRR